MYKNDETIEIYFDDLKEEVQNEIKELLKDDEPYQQVPIAELYLSEDDD